MEVLSAIVTIFGVLMSLSYFPQAYKIIKKKKSDEISLITFGTFVLGTLAWLVYGIALRDIPLIITFSIGVLGTASIFVLALLYR